MSPYDDGGLDKAALDRWLTSAPEPDDRWACESQDCGECDACVADEEGDRLYDLSVGA